MRKPPNNGLVIQVGGANPDLIFIPLAPCERPLSPHACRDLAFTYLRALDGVKPKMRNRLAASLLCTCLIKAVGNFFKTRVVPSGAGRQAGKYGEEQSVL